MPPRPGTDLTVSDLCLGGNVFGWTASGRSVEQLDALLPMLDLVLTDDERAGLDAASA